jgi:hypothetical protein
MSKTCLNVGPGGGLCPHLTWWSPDGTHCHLLNRFVLWHPRQDVYTPSEAPTSRFPQGCVSTESLARQPHAETAQADADIFSGVGRAHSFRDSSRPVAGSHADAPSFRAAP